MILSFGSLQAVTSNYKGNKYENDFIDNGLQ